MIQFLEAVGDPQGRQWFGAGPAESLYGGQHCALTVGIEKCRRFVQQQQPRVAGKGSGDRKALLLATAERMDRAGFQSAQSKQVQQ